MRESASERAIGHASTIRSRRRLAGCTIVSVGLENKSTLHVGGGESIYNQDTSSNLHQTILAWLPFANVAYILDLDQLLPTEGCLGVLMLL